MDERRILCHACRRVLGQTDGETLTVGNARFERTVTFRCLCGKRRQWVPNVARTPVVYSRPEGGREHA